MASVMPKSMNTALATILAPTVLGMEPNASRPSVVWQSYLSGSSERRIDAVVGIFISHAPRLFCSLQYPFEPSLNDSATGVIESLVMVAHPVVATINAIERTFFILISLVSAIAE